MGGITTILNRGGEKEPIMAIKLNITLKDSVTIMNDLIDTLNDEDMSHAECVLAVLNAADALTR